MRTTPGEAEELFEKIAFTGYQWHNERKNIPKKINVIEVDNYSNSLARIETLISNHLGIVVKLTVELVVVIILYQLPTK